MTYIAEARPRRRTSPAERRHNPLELRLLDSRVSRARIDSHIRTLLGRRNEAIAAAMADKVPLFAISDVVGIRATDVKRLGRAFYELDLSGAPQEWHLSVLRAIADQLTAAFADKELGVEKLRNDVLDGLDAGTMDIFRIAALTALPAERIRELSRPAR